MQRKKIFITCMHAHLEFLQMKRHFHASTSHCQKSVVQAHQFSVHSEKQTNKHVVSTVISAPASKSIHIFPPSLLNAHEKGSSVLFAASGNSVLHITVAQAKYGSFMHWSLLSPYLFLPLMQCSHRDLYT